MTLKECFTYMNKLTNTMDTIYRQLAFNDTDYALSVRRKHFKAKVCSDAEDIDETITPDRKYDYSAKTLISLMLALTEEKKVCADAITAAKRNLPEDLDTIISKNKTMQKTVELLSHLASLKTSTKEEQGTGYKFNAEGNQVPYLYTIEESTSITFDRNAVKTSMKAYMTEIEKNSTAVDLAMVSTNVDFTPKWNLNDTFEDMCDSMVLPESN